MEQRLKEFRDRKKLQKETEETETRAECSEQRNSCETQRVPDPEPAEPPNRNNQDTWSWLLDSALGRWLGTERLALSNLSVLKLLLWLVLLGLFSELEFGLPFFLLSLFYWLYEGLRGPAPRPPGQLSAYSVFNPDCQPILGTLTAEQLEAEMGYRPMNTRTTT